MAQQHINLGTPPSGADGDTTRIAWDKAESNFNELYARPIAVGKNRIINGDFRFWQRGTSFASAPGVGRYCADRFSNYSTGSGAAISRQAFAAGQTDVPGNPAHFQRATLTSVAGAANYVLCAQPIEDVRTLSGQAATLSFYAKADQARQISVEFTQDFGAGGSPSAAVSGIGVTKVNLTTAWQKFTVTVALPSLAGKTIGTTTPGFLQVLFWFDAGGNWNARTNSLGQQPSGTIDLALVQLEAGDKATTFEHRPFGTELALCQRYFEKSYNLDVNPGTPSSIAGSEHWFLFGVAGASYAAGARCPFKVQKRSTPAISVYSPVSGSTGMIASAAPAGDYGATVSDIGTAGFFAYSAGVSTNNINLSWHWVADSEL